MKIPAPRSITPATLEAPKSAVHFAAVNARPKKDFEPPSLLRPFFAEDPCSELLPASLRVELEVHVRRGVTRRIAKGGCMFVWRQNVRGVELANLSKETTSRWRTMMRATQKKVLKAVRSKDKEA